MNLHPFSSPEHTTLKPWHVKSIETLLKDGKEPIVAIGKQALRGGTVMLPSHFHQLGSRMGYHSIERSFKRGACLGAAFLSLHKPFEVDDETLLRHLQDLQSYRNEGETFASAAVRLGTAAVSTDIIRAKCTDQATILHDDKEFDATLMHAGASYMQLIAERSFALRLEADLDARSTAESLNNQYADELADIFKDMD